MYGELPVCATVSWLVSPNQTVLTEPTQATGSSSRLTVHQSFDASHSQQRKESISTGTAISSILGPTTNCGEVRRGGATEIYGITPIEN